MILVEYLKLKAAATSQRLWDTILQNIDMTRHFLSWKITSQEISRDRVNLSTSIEEGMVSFSKEEMTSFMVKLR